MFGSDFSFSDRITKKRVLLQAKHRALRAIDSAVCDGSITTAEAEVLKRQVVAIYLTGSLRVGLERPIQETYRKTRQLEHKISRTFLSI